MSKNTMSLEELRSSYVEVSNKINGLWKSGVKNKLNLAKEFISAVEMVKMCDNSVEAMKVYNDFLNELPFGKSTGEKFIRIGRAEWLWEVDPSNLPNDYNTLESLATEKVSGNKVVVEYMKEKLTPSVGRDDISGMVDKAIEEDSRGRYEPNPETDVTISGAPSSSNDNEGEDGSGDTPKVETKSLLTIKVSKETLEKGIGANRETLMGFVTTMNKVIKTLEKMDGNFVLDTEASDKVVSGLLKKIESRESRARTKAIEDVSIRNLKIAA
jgi:hypothetical protein